MTSSAETPGYIKRRFSVVSKAENSTEGSGSENSSPPAPPAEGSSTTPPAGEGEGSGTGGSPPTDNNSGSEENNNNENNNNNNNEGSGNAAPSPPPHEESQAGNTTSAESPPSPPSPPPSTPTPSTPPKNPPAEQNSGSNSNSNSNSNKKNSPSSPSPPSNEQNESPESSSDGGGEKSPKRKSPPEQSGEEESNQNEESTSDNNNNDNDSPNAPKKERPVTPGILPQQQSAAAAGGAVNPPPAAIGSPPGQAGTVNSPVSGGNDQPGRSSSSQGSSNSGSNSTNSNKGSSNGNTAVIVGSAVVVSVILIALIVIIIATRKKKKTPRYATPPYMTPPNNFSALQQSDPYYYGQGPHSMGYNSDGQNHSYGSQHYSGAFGTSGSNGGKYSSPDSGLMGGGKSFFSHEEVMEMTKGFARENIIGEGGFGYVFKGCKPDGKLVAVKQLKAGSGQGDREFKAEIEIISRVHHRHLVSLVGYSMSDQQRLLIYEFLPNNTLEYHLHAKGRGLDWSHRLRIAIGAAKGLAYLHEDCNPKIIHRDIKSANILLTDDFEAQVADFGLARLNDTTQTHVSTRVMGTFGYLAPEYAQSGKLTDRSDVYSFGVVLLELITGKKPVDSTRPLGDESLVEWARPHLMHAMDSGDLDELVDPRLEKRYVEAELVRMIETAAACIRHNAPKRPRMVQVVRALDSDESRDLTNGMKYGQSTMYNSGQYNEEIMKFRRMALGSDDSGEFGYTSGGGYNSREMSHGPPTSTGDYTSSGELETRAINRPPRNW